MALRAAIRQCATTAMGFWVLREWYVRLRVRPVASPREVHNMGALCNTGRPRCNLAAATSPRARRDLAASSEDAEGRGEGEEQEEHAAQDEDACNRRWRGLQP